VAPAPPQLGTSSSLLAEGSRSSPNATSAGP
jgi:hypothetical protein